MPVSAPAQLFHLGVKGGVPFTDAVNGSFGTRSEAKRYVVGPMVELRLPFSFAIEANALYRRTGYSATEGNLGATTVTQVRANSFEFPILAKYYLAPVGPLRPYVSGGYVVRGFTGLKELVSSFGSVIAPNTNFLLQDNPTHGAAFGGGLRLNARLFSISPEIRYTRWGGRPFDLQGSRGFFVQSRQNQLDFLVGFTF